MRKVKFSISVKNFQNDMLWRLWISDSSYLKHNNLGIFVSKEDAGDCSVIDLWHDENIKW